MTFLSALLLAILLPVLCVGPGYYFIRRLKWSDTETLCCSIGLSVVLIYLVGTLVYLTGISWKFCWIPTAAGFVLTFQMRSELARFLTKDSIRAQLRSFGLLLTVGLLAMALITHYAGGKWSGDWIEHAQRSWFFLHHDPKDFLFIDRYLLPARPPLMNILTAYFLAHVGDGFDRVQLIFQFLNLLVYFPCVLLSQLLIPRVRGRAWLIAIFLALSPFVLENATWTWTKLLSAFFVLLALALYLRGWRRSDASRMIAAGLSMSAGILVHYSAAPYGIALLLHYLIILPSRKRKLTELLGGAGASAVLLMTWLAWSMAFYGVKTTFGSNSTVTESEHLSLSQNLAKIVHNAGSTIIPHPLRESWRSTLMDFYQPNPFGFVRDYFFVMYQSNLLLAWGLIGWIGVIVLTVSQLKRVPLIKKFFWTLFLIVSICLGIASHGPAENFGVAHVCLQPVVLLGLTLLASGFLLLPRWARTGLAIFMIVDVVLGTILNLRLETQRLLMIPAGGALIMPINPGLPSIMAIRNSLARHALKLAYWADQFGPVQIAIYFVLLVGMGVMIFRLISHATRKGHEPLGLSRSYGLAGGLFFLAMGIACAMDRSIGYDGEVATFPQSDVLPSRLEQALASPESSSAQEELGLAYYNLGKLDPARDSFLEAFMLDPTNLQARYELALLLGTHGQMPADTPMVVPETVLEDPDNVPAQLAEIQLLFNHKHMLTGWRRLRDLTIAQPNDPLVIQAISKIGVDFNGINREILRLEGNAQ